MQNTLNLKWLKIIDLIKLEKLGLRICARPYLR